ncbi:hypothetical protein PRZ48_001092 [Zasmidium cellare]|uniref:Nuclear GTPase SLIP-GC n=1 Tax=Zasmidium cellare TaxID=395010 RepID=A0ABR0F0C3_ZASCE|nr:hypothetical protein PRZ48_001092 [Zasmidium cellare]
MASEEVTFRTVKALLPQADAAYEAILRERSSRLYVAILKHSHSEIPLEPAVDDFMWLKAHGKLALTRIVAAYKAQEKLDDDTPLQLKVDGQAWSAETVVSQLPVREQFLIMSAHIEQPAASQQSTNSNQSQRTPLQPVARQLTVPPVNSQDENVKATTPNLSASPAVATPPTGTMNAQSSTEPAENVSRPSTAQASTTPQLGAMAPEGYLPSPQRAPRVSEPPRRRVKQESTEAGIGSATMPADDQIPMPAAAPKAEEQEQETQYEPRDQGNPFTQNGDDVEIRRGQKLQQLGAETIPERLEAGVAAGLEVLASVQQKLQQLGEHPDAINWNEQIEKVRKDASRTRTVVGVVGNTGAGKSSVINAMLEEERLVPTNCMRACTAVVTELSYNESTNPNMKYRAVIEFIQPEDWEKELHVLFKDMFEESGALSKDISNAESDAGIAYAKVRAVYHKHTREMLANTSVASLMNQKHVKNVLGRVRTIREGDPKQFYKHLQQYVDSKEKGTEKLDKNGNINHNAKREFELWPLIKVVKIYTKADALSTGACIVDLPGVHDSNAARAAVATSYLKECTGLWIVAPINRAVDDKAAKTLLGDTFKRQLKFDGSYSAISFICSKTDDISRMEASDSLNLGDELDDKLVEVETRRKELNAELKDKKGKKSDYEETIDQVEEQLEEWEALSDQMGQGKTVYPPTQKKRKRRSSSTGANKRRRRARVDDSDDESNDGSPEAQDDETPDETQEPLTEQAIEDKLEELKQMKKDARREKNMLTTQIDELKELLEGNADEIDEINAQQNALCIAGRNKYSRGAIQQDFAAGIRELDQETAQDEDPDNFNPEEDIRDYDAVAKSLPVFCVSSRAFQKLQGRMKKDNDVPGFRNIDETEIPQLQAHCKKLTEKGRQATCRRFLNNLQSLLTSMGLWASDDGSGIKLTAAQRDVEKAFLQRELKKLEAALEKTVNNTLEDAVASLNEQLFEKFDGAIKNAVNEALPTSSRWGAHKNDGGLYWSTYKATVRRSGVYTSAAAGHRDFNGDLTEPLYKHLATAWEKTFQRRLPNILQSCTKSATDVVKKFHAAVEQRVREKGHGISRIGMIGGQLQTHSAKFADLVAAAIETLNNGQRDINREFTPVIANAMESSYTFCTDESGPGQYKRMKAHMHDHVSAQRSTMFRTAAESVRKGLMKLCSQVKDVMLDKADEVYVLMQRDYLTLVGVQRSEIRMSREERAARREVDDAIGAADAHFSKVLDADLEELKVEAQQQENEGADAVDDIAENEMDVDDEDDDSEDGDAADKDDAGDDDNEIEEAADAEMGEGDDVAYSPREDDD